MPTLDQLYRDVGQIRRELGDLVTETRTNDAAIAGAIRKTRLQVTAVEQNQAQERIRQPATLLGWDPRQGLPTSPALAQSLVDRLKRGNPVADSFGNTDQSYGQRNLLLDPGLDSLPSIASIGTTYSSTLPWIVGRVLNSGTAPAVRSLTSGHNRGFGSSMWSTATGTFGIECSASTNSTFYVTQAVDWDQPEMVHLPYIVAAVRVAAISGTDVFTNVTSCLIRLELLRDGAVAATSGIVNFKTDLFDVDQQRRLYCSYFDLAMANHTWNWRLRIDVVTSGAGGILYPSFGEDQLQMTYSPDPPMFVPQVGGWMPEHVFGVGDADQYLISGATSVADTAVPDVVITEDGQIMWAASGGTAFDLRLRRTGVSQLTLDDSVGGPASFLGGGFPVGGSFPWPPGGSAPPGFVYCDGASYLRAGAMAALFAVIGTIYGAADGTHFNVPDYRGRFVLGTDGGHAIATTGGAIDHTHSTPNHQHTGTVDQSGSGGGPVAGSGNTREITSHVHTFTSASGGSGTSGTNNPPYISQPWIIKI